MLQSASLAVVLASLVVVSGKKSNNQSFVVATPAQRKSVLHVFGTLRRENYRFSGIDVIPIDGSLLLYLRIKGVQSETVIDCRLDGLIVISSSYSSGDAHFHGSASYDEPGIACVPLLAHLRKEKK